MSFGQLTDLDGLSQRCYTKSGRALLQEAILCYRIGAFRAATLSIWQAIVFDYIDKLEELSGNGDKFASIRLSEFRTYEKQKNVSKLLEFERCILEDLRKDLQLITVNEVVDLDRIKEDRNRCSHLTFNSEDEPFVPAAEQVRAHIVNAFNILLVNPPKHGKAALSELIAYFKSPHFPTDEGTAIIRLKKTSLGSARSSLTCELLKFFLKNAFESNYSQSEDYFQKIFLISVIQRESTIECLSKKCDKIYSTAEVNGNFHKIIILLSKSPDIFNLLPDLYKKEAIVGYEKIISSRHHVLIRESLASVAVIFELLNCLVKNVTLLSDELVESALESSKRSEFMDEIVKRYSKSSSYSSSGNLGRALIRQILFIDQSSLETIFKAYSENDQIHNYMRGTEVIENLFLKKKIDEQKFRGLVAKYQMTNVFSDSRISELKNKTAA